MNQPTWNTADEILWLKRIGQVHEHTRLMDEAELLARYLDGARRRSNWGWVNKAQVVRHVAQRIATLTAESEVPA
jgi:hypothetical protein